LSVLQTNSCIILGYCKLSILILLIFYWSPTLGQGRGVTPLSVSVEGQLQRLYQESHALLIGNSRYIDGYADLPGVSNDIPKVKAALEQHGFNVVVAEDLSSYELDRQFRGFISHYGVDSKNRNNRLLFYYAGHGESLAQGNGRLEGYLVPTDAPLSSIDKRGFVFSAMPMSRLLEYARMIESKHALFLLDACFSGSLFSQNRSGMNAKTAIDVFTTKDVRQFISAGRADQPVPDESIFTHFLIKALTTTEADGSQDGYLTGSELASYLEQKVLIASNKQQHPQYDKMKDLRLSEGDFVFELPGSVAKITENIEVEVVAPSKGSLILESAFAGSVYLNGQIVENGIKAYQPIKINGLNAGAYNLRITGEGFNWERAITIKAGEEARVMAEATAPAPTDLLLPQMVQVSGGTFKMGSKNGESDERPVHAVTLSSFAIGKYEVTLRQYLAFVQATGKHHPEWMQRDSKYNLQTGYDDYYKKKGISDKQLDLPVVGISWHNAVAYCQWLSQQTGGHYRLPTEAEWEFAARGGMAGNGYLFSGSSAIEKVGWYLQNADGKLKEVGKLQPNELGIYDMSGNVQEWCADWYGEDYYRLAAATNPQGPDSGKERVIRGGSFSSDAGSLYPTDRRSAAPDTKLAYYGFRVCKSK